MMVPPGPHHSSDLSRQFQSSDPQSPLNDTTGNQQCISALGGEKLHKKAGPLPDLVKRAKYCFFKVKNLLHACMLGLML